MSGGLLPFTYLGLPLSTNKLKIEDFTAMMQRIERRISGYSTLISYDGRLQLIKSVFSSLPTYFMCCLALPLGVVEQINKYLKHCFWRKYGRDEKGSAMIAWDIVCKPKSHGGLGVLDLIKRKKEFLLKNLHKFFNKENLPWVNMLWETYYTKTPPNEKLEGSHWWKSLLKLIPLYKEVAKCTVGSGQAILFWKDSWTEQPLNLLYPELHSFAISNNNTVVEMINCQDLADQFHRPLTLQAYNQFTTLEQSLNHINLTA